MLNPLNFFSKFIKSSNQRELDRLEKIVNKINLLEETTKELEDSAFPKKTLEFKEKIKNAILDGDIRNDYKEAHDLMVKTGKSLGLKDE